MKEKFILVGTVRESKAKIVGYRVLDVASRAGSVVTADKFPAFIKQNEVLGVAIEGGKVTGTNGAIDRYPILNTSGQLVDNNSVIVLSAKGDKFLCSDFNGTVVPFTEKELINYATRSGNSIANGKIVTKGNKKFISAISGTYPELYIPEEKKPATTDKKPASKEEIIKDIKYCLNKVAKEVIRRGYGIRDYEAVGDAMMDTGIAFSYQMKDEANFEKVVNLAIDLFNKGRKAE
jgi:hypothetical protein